MYTYIIRNSMAHSIFACYDHGGSDSFLESWKKVFPDAKQLTDTQLQIIWLQLQERPSVDAIVVSSQHPNEFLDSCCTNRYSMVVSYVEVLDEYNCVRRVYKDQGMHPYHTTVA